MLGPNQTPSVAGVGSREMTERITTPIQRTALSCVLQCTAIHTSHQRTYRSRSLCVHCNVSSSELQQTVYETLLDNEADAAVYTSNRQRLLCSWLRSRAPGLARYSSRCQRIPRQCLQQPTALVSSPSRDHCHVIASRLIIGISLFQRVVTLATFDLAVSATSMLQASRCRKECAIVSVPH